MMNKKILVSAALIFTTIGVLFYKYFDRQNTLSTFGYGYKNLNAISSAKGEIANFSLLDHQGVFQELYRNSDAKAIVIISQGNDCPIIQKYSSIINDLKNKYESDKIHFFLINANQQDTRQAIIEEAKSYNFKIPILMDPSQLVTESLGITRTSEAVVINPIGWKIMYRGSISDRLDYGVDKQNARHNYLDDILGAIVKNKRIESNAVAAKGCLISFAKPQSLSYEKTIAPILQQKCLSCHSESGSFLPKFSNYDKIKNWVAMSRETILTDRMPPYSADPLFGTYQNDISLSPEEKRTLVKWIDEGAARDGTQDPLIGFKPKQKTFSNFKTPLYVAEMKTPHLIPAGGEIEYKYFQLGGPVPFEMWTKGYLTKSTSPRQLHHESLFVVSHPLAFYEALAKKKFEINEDEIKKNTDGDIFLYTLVAMEKYENQYNPDLYTKFQVWGAGRPQPFIHAKMIGSHIPKGSYLILEAHYMGTGKVETEKTTVNFYGVRTKPPQLKEIHNLTLTNTNYWVAKKDIHIRSFLGHLHMRGKSVKVQVQSPTGEIRTIVSIPNYNYGWQTGAAINPTEPIAIKAGSILKAICHYDNSPQNPYNPEPNKKIRFGQRVDRSEMCKFNSGYTID
jgi:hypothetical protein